MQLVDLLWRVGMLVFAAGGAFGAGRMILARLEALEKRITADMGQLRADLREVHARINAEVARSVVVPLRRGDAG